MIHAASKNPSHLTTACTQTGPAKPNLGSITFAYNMIRESLVLLPKLEPWASPSFIKLREHIDYLEATVEIQQIFITNPWELPRDSRIKVQSDSYRKEYQATKEEIIRLKKQYYKAIIDTTIKLNNRVEATLIHYADKHIDWAHFAEQLNFFFPIVQSLFKETNTIFFRSIHRAHLESTKDDTNQHHVRGLSGTWFKIEALSYNPWSWRCPNTFASLLHIAALNADLPFAKVLVRLGLCTWDLDKHGNRPNDIARAMGHVDFIKAINIYAANNNPQMQALAQNVQDNDLKSAFKMF